MAKRVSARETAFLKPKCAMKAHFDQMKVSERGTESKKNLNEVFPTIKKKTHQFHVIKKKQRCHPQDSGNLFPLQKNSKTKNFENCFQKIIFKKLIENFLFSR